MSLLLWIQTYKKFIFYQSKDVSEIEIVLNEELRSICLWVSDNKLMHRNSSYSEEKRHFQCLTEYMVATKSTARMGCNVFDVF